MLSKKTKIELVAEVKKLQKKIDSLKRKNEKISSIPSKKLIKEIAQRKKTENDLNNTQKYTRLLIDSSLDMICASDKNGFITEFNYAAQQIFGYKHEEVLGKHLSMLFADNQEPSKITDKEIFISGSFTGEVLNKKKSGEHFISYLSASVLKNKMGVTIGSMGVSRDVTAIKKIELELRKSEERYRDLFENATDLIQSIDANGKILYANSAWKKTMGFSEDELAEKTIFDFIHPKSVKRCIKLLSKILDDGKIDNAEIIFLSKSGHPIICEGNINSKFEQGKLNSIRGIFRDVTVNRQVAKQIKEKEENYLAIYNQAYIGIAQVALTGNFIHVNDHLCQILGYSKEELYKMSFSDLTSESDLEKSMDIQNKVLNGTIDKATFEKKYIHKSGKPVNINLTLSVVRDGEKKPMYIISVFQNITDRIIAENEKQRQSAQLNSIIESSSHIIWMVDKNLSLTTYNKNYSNQFEQLYGKAIKLGDSIFSKPTISNEQETTDFLKKKYQKAFSGNPQYFEKKQIQLNGNECWQEVYLNPIFDKKNNVIEVSGIAHDITEKKLIDKKTLQSLQEKEVLLKEVHHRVKNNLQVISSILNLQSSYVKDKKTLSILKESQDRIKSMAFIHESLYQTKDFSSINLSEYLEKLTMNLFYSYSNLDYQVKLNLDIQNVFLNLDLAIPCGLVINEIVSNAFKYAFLKNRVNCEISLKISLVAENLILSIGDNGIGLPKKFDFRNTESLGLQLVVSLVDQLNGVIELDNTKGANYTIVFKQNQGKKRI